MKTIMTCAEATALLLISTICLMAEEKEQPSTPQEYNSVVQIFVQPMKPIASIPRQLAFKRNL